MTRHRAWVAASLAARCELCRGQRQVLLWPVGAPELAAPSPCPHCVRHLPLAINPTKDRP